jgi:endonuclease/exonuclease/phosphatase family metal-dependent hydrolase
MKWLASLASILLLATATQAAPQPVRVVSFNVRYATSSPESGEKPWWDLFCGITATRCRQRFAIQQFKDTAANAPPGAITVFGLQEVLDNQLKDIKNGLGSNWDHVGIGRDDGKSKGEFSPIIYRTDALRLLYSETKWLSPTPDVVSFGWGAGSRRIVTIAVFESLTTGKRFLHANTHLDNVSSQARSEGIKVVVNRIKAVQGLWGPLAVQLTGDFNSQAGSDAYQALVGTGYVKDIGTNAGTFTGFQSTTPIARFDYIWLGPANENRYTVQRFDIINNIIDGVYVSDHRMVVGDVTVL